MKTFAQRKIKIGERITAQSDKSIFNMKGLVAAKTFIFSESHVTEKDCEEFNPILRLCLRDTEVFRELFK